MLTEDVPPEGERCERPRPSGLNFPRELETCGRPAIKRDKDGKWACAIHLGADKRASQARIRAWYRSQVRAGRRNLDPHPKWMERGGE